MPRGPRPEKRPADVIGNAIKVMRIGTGEEEHELTPMPGRSRSVAQARKLAHRSYRPRREVRLQRTRLRLLDVTRSSE
jgi:hypothetical protein